MFFLPPSFCGAVVLANSFAAAFAAVVVVFGFMIS
jgi:hypothetical protein